MSDDFKVDNPIWQRTEGVRGNERFVIGYRTPYFVELEKKQYPYHVLLTYAYDKEGSARLPDAEEWKAIDGFEQAFLAELRKDNFGVLVFTLANDGLYQWNIYTKEGNLADLRLMSVLPKQNPRLPGQPAKLFEFGSDLDRSWKNVDPFIKLMNTH